MTFLPETTIFTIFRCINQILSLRVFLNWFKVINEIIVPELEKRNRQNMNKEFEKKIQKFIEPF